MGRYRRLREVSLAVGMAGLLAGCAGFMASQPTAVPGRGPLGVPQPTATQIAVGANPSPSAPRMNQFSTPVRSSGGRGSENSYAWLENVHSPRARHWIALENEKTARALAGIPQRAWLVSRLQQLEAAGQNGASNDVIVEHVLYLGPDGTRLPMEIAHRRDLPRDGNQPTLLSVYRAASKPPSALLQPFVLTWAAMGGIYARAQVRDGVTPVHGPGGTASAMPAGAPALTDLFAAAQSLIDQHYTRRGRLGIYGRGFGGLLAGAALTRRPDFFAVALPSGTWAQYRQITSGNCFPPTLIVTAERDGSIRPWLGYELAAVLQAEQICGRPILIRIDSEETQSAQPMLRREHMADELAFAAKWLGAQPPG
jgi:prolyl oligopeptidase PreP (S9A serine peptidase family)